MRNFWPNDLPCREGEAGQLFHALNQVKRGEIALEGIGVGFAIGGEARRPEEERGWVDQLQFSPDFLMAGPKIHA